MPTLWYREVSPPPRRTRYYESYSSSTIELVRHRRSSSPVFIRELRSHTSRETDDEYCRRKDREYARVSDEIVEKKEQKEQFKEWKEKTTDRHSYKHLKREYERLDDEITVLERRKEGIKREVLRRL